MFHTLSIQIVQKNFGVAIQIAGLVPIPSATDINVTFSLGAIISSILVPLTTIKGNCKCMTMLNNEYIHSVAGREQDLTSLVKSGEERSSMSDTDHLFGMGTRDICSRFPVISRAMVKSPVVTLLPNTQLMANPYNDDMWSKTKYLG